MLKNFSTKAKLMLVPIVYVIIVTIVAIIFSYYNNLVKFRIDAATQTDVFIQQVLKGRISVYQFLRAPSNDTANVVIKDFGKLDENVSFFKSQLSVGKNVQLCEEILSESSKYVEYFDKFSQKRIEEYKNGILKESEDLKPLIADMAKTGTDLENKLNEINKSAIELRNEAETTMNYILIGIVIVSIILFVIFSIILSNIIVSSIEKFKRMDCQDFCLLLTERAKIANF